MDAETWVRVARKYPWQDIGGGNIRSTVVRLAYANLFVPRAYEAGSKERYGTTLLLPEGDTAQPLVAGLVAALKGAFGPECKISKPNETNQIRLEGTENGQSKKMILDWPIIDQGERSSTGFVEGSLCVAAYSQVAPAIADVQRRAITDQGAVYSGCYAFVTVRPYWSKQWKRLCVGLQGVQKLAEGERLAGGAPPIDSQFEDVAGEFAGLDFGAATSEPTAEDLLA